MGGRIDGGKNDLDVLIFVYICNSGISGSEMANKTSQHILSTSANLLGFCLFVITAVHLTDKRELTYVDELTAIVSLLLAVSSVLSFLSIRTEQQRLEKSLESAADYLFIISLMGIMIIIAFIALNII